MLIIDPEYSISLLDDNYVKENGGIPGNLENINEKLGGVWSKFYCANCKSWQDYGLKWDSGLQICMNCMTESYGPHTGTVGTKIKVFSGKYLDLKNPDPNDIDIRDIIAGLSNNSRYSGQFNPRRWLSVAEHSINCFDVAVHKEYNREQLTAVLMHDASEGYMCDLSRPLKQMLPVYKWLEGRVQNAISRKFNIDFKSNYALIKAIDEPMLLAERFAIYGDDGVEWERQNEIEKIECKPQYLKPSSAYERFLSIWDWLQYAGT